MTLQKENDIKQLMKTENRTDTNRKQNGRKQKTQRVKTKDSTEGNRKLNDWKHGV